MRHVAALAAVLAAAGAASAAFVDLPVPGVGVCTFSIENVRCPTPAPGSTRTPAPSPIPVRGCPPDALDLNHPLETQPTLRGYYGVTYSGRRTFRYCARPNVSSNRGANLGAAWIDMGASQCSQLKLRLVSFNGAAVQGGVTGWSGTPQLTYKLLFPGFVAPGGEYFFELDADASSCPDGVGKFQIIWTP